MDLRETWGFTLPETAHTSNPQVLFEGATLAVLAQILDSGTRIDLAVADYLGRFPLEGDSPHVRPDLIICVSDCLKLLLRGEAEPSAARLILDDASRLWHQVRANARQESDRTITRVQACIGNIRRAIEAAGGQTE
ncbi:MAG: hypothetical protein HY055_07105 [Magnetospirillum sp.]|nr:hypothetical protein [Magnetospirillum sp.]